MARIRRFHRRGRGSIPRKGVFVLNVFPIYFYVQNRFHFPQSLTNSADWRLKLTIIKHASSRIIITINTNTFHRCYIITVRCTQEVRMAERSKAPDSRVRLFPVTGVFWSTYVGVGSNPTSDKYFLIVIFISIIMFTITTISKIVECQRQLVSAQPANNISKTE